MDGMNRENLNMAMPPEKEKKSGGAIRFIIPVVVFVVLVAVVLGVAIATGTIGENKRKTIGKAIAKTCAQSRDGISGVWEMEEYADMFSEEQMHIDADIDITDLGNMEMQINSDKERCGMSMDISAYGMRLGEIYLYMDEEEIRMTLPELDDYVFYVDLTNIEDDLEEFIEEYDFDDETADYLRALSANEQNKNSGSETLDEATEQFVDGLMDILAKSKVKVEKTSDKTLTVNGSERTCKGYVMTIPSDNVADMVLLYKEIYEENEPFRSYLDGIMQSFVGADLEYEDVIEIFEEIAKEQREEDDLEVYYYIYDGIIAQMSFENENLSFEWNVYGGNFPLENMDLTYSFGTSEFELTRNGSMDGDVYYAEYEILFDGDGIAFDVEYDKKQGDIALEIEYDYYTMFISGNIDKTVPGEELAISIDTIELDDMEIMSGDIVISNECEDIEMPEGELYNVLRMDEDDWYEILWEMMEFLY